MRRISDRRCPPVTASNAQVVRLAPPVSVRRFSIVTPAPRVGANTCTSVPGKSLGVTSSRT